MKKILFLTTHNFATNPRLVKEIRLAIANKFEVEVICFEFNNWSYEFNQQIKNEFTIAGVVLHVLQAGRKPFTKWLQSVASEKIARWVSRFVTVKTHILSNGVSRRSMLILNELKKIKNVGCVIGHNPGALWPTLKAAEKFKCKAGFDVEDYHPGEGSNVHMQNLAKQLLQQALPEMDYVSFASPSIRAEVRNDLGSEGRNWRTVLNYFPAGEFLKPASIEGPLKFVWFSQNIAAGRGLELILASIAKLPGKAELHLFGKVDPYFYKSELEGLNNVILYNPLPQVELHNKLREFDIGLALEPAKDRNNALAISNKILACMQAGLYVMATDTPAQQAFIKEHSSHGEIFKISEEAAGLALTELLNRITTIRAGREERYQRFQNNHWESESADLLETWESLFS